MTKRKFTRPDQAPKGHKWNTLDGSEVILCREVNENALYSISGWIIEEDDSHMAENWTLDGRYQEDKLCDTSDLVDVDQKFETWLNIYPLWVQQHKTKEDADKFADTDRIACKRVKYKIGDKK